MTDRELQAYYARDEERDRLSGGVGLIEFLRTVEVIERTLPPPGAVIADIGGGPGRYTDRLVGAGYQIIHRDVVARHVDQVRRRHGRGVDAAVGDARCLDLADDSVDVVLLLGPLYHLENREDRLAALGEARRVVRPGGIVHGAAISRWAPRLHGMLVDRFHLKYPQILEMIDPMERSGSMPPVHEGSFTGYAHTPPSWARRYAAPTCSLSRSSRLRGSPSPCPIWTTGSMIPTSGLCSSASCEQWRRFLTFSGSGPICSPRLGSRKRHAQYRVRRLRLIRGSPH